MKATLTPPNQSLTENLELVSKNSKYGYRLVDYKNGRHKTDVLLSQTKCNLEILPEGILVSGNFTPNSSMIPVMKNELESITLIRGKEIVDTFPLSPMHILSKLGVPNSLSRYLSILPSEYKISETKLIIKCNDQQLILITRGNKYESLLRSFRKMGYQKQLKLVEKPSINVPRYTTDLEL